MKTRREPADVVQAARPTTPTSKDDDEDVFLAYAQTAVDTMRARLADPSFRHRSQTAVSVTVPENTDDRRPYVERPTWKPRVSAFRTHNAFFQYQSRRPASIIVLNA